MIFSYIHSAYSHAGHPLQTKIMMTQTKYDDRYLILHVSCITLVTLVTLIRQVTLATVVTLVILVTMVTLFWSSTGPRVSPFRFSSLFLGSWPFWCSGELPALTIPCRSLLYLQHPLAITI